MLFIASEGSKGQLYDLEDNTIVRNYAVNNSGPFSSAYCPASDTVVAHQTKNCSFFLSAHTQQPVHRSFTPEPVTCTTVSSCGTYLVGGTTTGSLLVWNLLTGKLLRNFKAHLRAVHCVSFSSSTDLVVSASEDSLCKVWSLAALLNLAASDVQPCGTFTGHTRSVLCCTFFHHSDLVLTGSADRTCRVFNATTCESVMTVTLGDSVTALAVAPEDSRFVAGMQSGYLYFSDTHKRRGGSGGGGAAAAGPPLWAKLRPPSEDTHHSAIIFIGFCSSQSPCTRVLTASRDGSILWHDASTAKLIGEAVPKQRHGLISCCAVLKRATQAHVKRCLGIDKNPVDPAADDLALLRTVVCPAATAPSSRKRARVADADSGDAARDAVVAAPASASLSDSLAKLQEENAKLDSLVDTLNEKIRRLTDASE